MDSPDLINLKNKKIKKLKILETDRRLSDSCLWDAEKNYYLNKGMEAWNGQVPFFITSNVFFAQESARVLAAYCRDLLKNKKLNLNQPIYILELGAGTGQFSFYCFQELLKLWDELGLSPLNFIYLVTDLSPENIHFCESHSNFKDFKDVKNFKKNKIKSGEIKFLVLDTDDLSPLDFLKSNPNPVLTIANYLFDSLKQDAFFVSEGRIHESLLTLEMPEEYLEKYENNLDQLQPSFHHCLLSPGDYYAKPSYDFILETYQAQLHEGSFLIPIGALDLLSYLLDLTQGKLLLLATDKGYASVGDFEGEEEPSLVFHGSFSFGVNFHALGLFAEKSGGKMLEIPMGEGIKSSVILWEKNNLNNLNLNQVLNHQIQELTLADFFNFYQQFKNSGKLSIELLLSFMRWSRWDPYIFSQFSQKILKSLNHSSANIITGFIQGIDNLLAHMYELPYGEDLYSPIAILFHTLHFYERALEIYKISENKAVLNIRLNTAISQSHRFMNLFNQGLCYAQLGDQKSAQDYFQKAKEFANPEDLKRLEKWLD